MLCQPHGFEVNPARKRRNQTFVSLGDLSPVAGLFFVGTAHMAAAAAPEPALEALHAKYADDSDEDDTCTAESSKPAVELSGNQSVAGLTAAAAAAAEQEQQQPGNSELQGGQEDDWYDEYEEEDDDDSDDEELYAALEWADDNEGVRLHGAAVSAKTVAAHVALHATLHMWRLCLSFRMNKRWLSSLRMLECAACCIIPNTQRARPAVVQQSLQQASTYLNLCILLHIAQRVPTAVAVAAARSHGTRPCFRCLSALSFKRCCTLPAKRSTAAAAAKRQQHRHQTGAAAQSKQHAEAQQQDMRA
jgi:hypothetical protein